MKLVTNKVRQFVSKKEVAELWLIPSAKIIFDIRLLNCSLKYQLICISACVDNWTVHDPPGSGSIRNL